MNRESSTPEGIGRLLRRIEKLPMLPAVALRILELTEDPNSSARDLAKLIETDQALAARTLKMANSAFYGRSGTVATIRDAVSLIGFAAIRSTVLSVSFMDLFKTSESRTGFDAEGFWVHSLACALCSREIGRLVRRGGSFAEQAFVCGMLHDAGKILLNNHLPGDYARVVAYVAENNVTMAEAERAILDVDHADVGGELLRVWKLPEHETLAIARHHREPEESAESSASAQLAEIVKLADTIVRIQGIGSGGDDVPRTVDPRRAKALGLTPEDISALAEDLEEVAWKAAEEIGIEKSEKRSTFELLNDSNRERILMRSLAISEGRYRLLFESFSDPLFLMSDVIHECNDQACRVLACERTDLVDHALSEFLPPVQPDGRPSAEILEERMRAALDGECQSFDCQVRRKDGSTLEAEVSLKAFPEGGANVVQAVLHDITERKRVEEQIRRLNEELEERVLQRTADLEKAYEELKKLDEMKDAFLSSVSHELRTPLTSIRSFSEILLRYDEEDPETRREFLEVIHEESKRLTRLINDVLDLSKIESGKMVWHDDRLSVEEVLRYTIRAHQPLIEQKALEVVLDVPPDLPEAFADRERIQQVASNLLDNAIKFSPERGRIELRAEAVEEPQGEGRPAARWVKVSVSDQGIGIDEKDFDSVFEKFAQVTTDTLRDKPKGTGLGLSICKEIVTRYGGRIGLVSGKGKGCTFFFTLPVAAEGQRAVEAVQENEERRP